MVELERLEDPEEMAAIHQMIKRHAEFTGSAVARRVLAQWHEMAHALRKSHAERL